MVKFVKNGQYNVFPPVLRNITVFLTRMNMNILKAALGLSLLLCISVSLLAAQGEQMRVGVFEQKPLLFKGKEGFLLGFYAELLKNLEKETGWKFKYELNDQETLRSKLEQGDLDLVMGLPFALNYVDNLNFSSESVLTVWGEVYTLQTNESLKNIFDVQDKVLAVRQNSPVFDAFRHQCDMFRLACEFKSYPDSPSVFAAVIDGRADAAIVDSLFGYLHAGDYALRRTPVVFSPTHLHIAASQHRSPRQLRKIDKILSAWKVDSNSPFYQAQQRWLTGKPLKVRRTQTAPPWQRTVLLATSAALILMLLGLSLLHIRSHKQLLRAQKDVNIAKIKEHKYHTLLESLPHGLEEIELNGVVVFANFEALKIHGLVQEEVVGQEIFQLLAPSADKLQLSTYIDQLVATQTTEDEEKNCEPFYTQVRHKNGKTLDVRTEWHYKRDVQGNVIGFYVVLTDITKVRETQNRIRDYHIDLKRMADERKASLIEAYNDLVVSAAVFENTGEAIMVMDLDACLESVNPAFEKITKFKKEEVIGQPLAMLASKKHDTQMYHNLWKQLVNNTHWQGEVWNQRANGEVYPAWLSINAVQKNNNQTERYVVLLSDITKRKNYEKQIWRQANYDALTKLPNRNLFHRRLEQALEQAREAQTQVGLMFIDLDHFKEVNDTLGHDAGDELLKAATKRLSASIRKNDTVARMGGDEFTVILPMLEHTDIAVSIAAGILEQLNLPFPLPQGQVKISGSIGIVIYPQDGDDITNLLKNADIAMYRIKTKGRNGYFLYEDLEDPDAVQKEASAVVSA